MVWPRCSGRAVGWTGFRVGLFIGLAGWVGVGDWACAWWRMV
ncbi:MAG: hypothetical protein RI897_1784 [Verrucomicrobiota bacterium]|jgi:hypothetical protein